MLRFLSYSAALFVLAGCYEHHRLEADASTDTAVDTTVDTSADPDVRPPDPTCPPVLDPLDILFVIDNSNSMSEEQASLAAGLNELFTGFAADGLDVRVGAVSTDMGTGGFSVFTCNEPNFGDDGVLRTTGNTALPGCDPVYPSFLSFGGGSAGSVASDARCIVQMGTNGCGFEQQLDSTLKALATSSDDVSFVSGTLGHGDGANSGFLRSNAALAIVTLTDEDDCSALDPDLYNADSVRYPGLDLNARCFDFPEAVHPVERYIGALAGLKRDPRRISYISIVGVPQDLEGSSYETILDDPRMQEVRDPRDPTTLTPSCEVPGRGIAFPPRRIVQVAAGLRDLDVQTEVLSICGDFPAANIRNAIRRSVGRCD